MSRTDILEGRFGIVTGAASGIGYATAIQLAKGGAQIAAVDIDNNGLDILAAAFDQENLPRPLIFPSDATKEQTAKRVIDEAFTTFGTIDFLVNSTGILRRTPFLDITLDEWDMMINVNLRGPLLFCKRVARIMADQKKGVIVNVASLAGRSSSILGGAHYTAAKHALIGLSRHMARELSPLGIRINAFCPGATLTPMTTEATTDEEVQTIANAIPRRKWASAEEQAAVIAFLVSDAAINITGACIDSNGGALMV